MSGTQEALDRLRLAATRVRLMADRARSQGQTTVTYPLEVVEGIATTLERLGEQVASDWGLQ